MLRRIVQQRIGQIIPQFGIICGVHAVCHLIVVIARIGNQSHGLAILNARHNDGAGIGIQRELGRGDIQILDPVYHKVVGCLRSRLKSAVLALIQFDDILFEQKAADLTAGHGIVVDQVAIDLFVEFFVFFQTLKNIVQNLLIDLDGIGIPGVDREVRHIDPVLRDRIVQIFIQTDDLVLRPGDIGRILLVHRVFHKDALIVQHGGDVALIDLILFGQLLIRSTDLLQLVSQRFEDLCLIVHKGLLYGLLRLSGVCGGKARCVYDIVVDTCVIDIVDRRHDVRAAGIFIGCIFLDIPYLIQKDTGELGFQNMITGFLEIGVDRKVDVPTCLGFHPVAGLDDFSEIVHVNGLRSLRSLQDSLHRGFDPGFADGVVQIVGRILSLQILQFLLRDLAGVTEDLRKIDAVVILADRSLCDRYTVELIGVFHHDSDGFLGNIVGNRRRDIFLIAVGAHGVTDRDELENLLSGIAKPGHKRRGVVLFIAPDPVMGGRRSAAEVGNDLLRRRIFFFDLEIVDGRIAVHIGKKTQKLRPFHIVLISSALSEHNMKIADHLVAVFFDQTDQRQDRLVQILILLSSGLVHILDRH